MNVFIGQFNNDTISLRTDECWHCFKVLRKKAGDQIVVIDGLGRMAKAEITFLTEKRCDAKLVEELSAGSSPKHTIHLAIAPTKQIDRIEWMIEKAVEIGVSELSFLKCKNSERVNLNKERIEKIVESAVKQSLRAHIPKVNDLVSFDQFIASAAKDNLRLIAHCESGEKVSLKSLDLNSKSILVCIGPEGDFIGSEISLALNNGFKGLNLGANRLRTETAGLYAVLGLQLLIE